MGSFTLFDIKAISDKEDPLLLIQFRENNPIFASLPHNLQLFTLIEQLYLERDIKGAIFQLETYFAIEKQKEFVDVFLLIYWLKFLFNLKQLDKISSKLDEIEEACTNFQGSMRENKFLHCTLQIIKGNVAIFKGHLTSAKNILCSLISDSKIYKFQAELAHIFNMIAKIEYSQGKIPKAIELLQKTYEIYKKLSIFKGMARILNNLALIHFKNEETDIAISNLKESTDLSEKCRDMETIADNMFNLGYIYANIGRFQDAENNYLESLAYFRKKEQKQRIAFLYANLGELYMYKKEFTKAHPYLQQACILFQKLNIEFQQIEPLNVSFLISLENDDELETLRIYAEMLNLLNKFPKKIDPTYLKLGNLLMVIKFKEKASTVELLELVKEIFNQEKMKIEFHVNALSVLIKIINSRIVNNQNSVYILELKEFTVKLTATAQRSSSYFILIHANLLDGNIAFIERNFTKLAQIVDDLETLNAKLHLEFLKPEIEKLKGYLND